MSEELKRRKPRTKESGYTTRAFIIGGVQNVDKLHPQQAMLVMPILWQHILSSAIIVEQI